MISTKLFRSSNRLFGLFLALFLFTTHEKNITTNQLVANSLGLAFVAAVRNKHLSAAAIEVE